MKKPFLHPFLLKETLVLKGSIRELKEQIDSLPHQHYRIVWTSHQQFKFIANSSVGTLSIGGLSGVEGIYGYGQLFRNRAAETTTLYLTTTFRIELYFFFPFFFLSILGAIIKPEVGSILGAIVLAFLLLGAFGFYRVQEFYLFKAIQQELI